MANPFWFGLIDFYTSQAPEHPALAVREQEQEASSLRAQEAGEILGDPLELRGCLVACARERLEGS